jgi:hypothetical protein
LLLGSLNRKLPTSMRACSRTTRRTRNTTRTLSAFSCLIVLVHLLTRFLKGALFERKKAVTTAQAKLSSLQLKIGKLRGFTNSVAIINANTRRCGTEKVDRSSK